MAPISKTFFKSWNLCGLKAKLPNNCKVSMKHAGTFVASMSFQAPNSCKQCGVAESVDLISDCFMINDQIIDTSIGITNT